MKIQFNIIYFTWAVVLFLIEVGIALFVHDEWIRPFFGDFLVVILLYCSLRSFFAISLKTAIVIVLFTSYLIEILQYFNYVERLGLTNNKLAAVVLGTYFSWADLLMYTLGLLPVVLIENIIKKKKTQYE